MVPCIYHGRGILNLICLLSGCSGQIVHISTNFEALKLTIDHVAKPLIAQNLVYLTFMEFKHESS